MEAVNQAIRGILKIEEERIVRREKARALIENNDIDGIAALILASEQRDAAKKGEHKVVGMLEDRGCWRLNAADYCYNSTNIKVR